MTDAPLTDETTVPASPPAPPPAAPPPPAPREVTRRVARRIWAEPRVRLWWGMAVALAGVSAFVAVAAAYGWSQDMALLRHGTPVSATVLTADADHWAGHPKPPESVVELQFDWQGQPTVVVGKLEDRQEPIVVKSQVPIHVDPRDPLRWTARVKPVPIGPELLGAVMALAAALSALAVGFVRRAAVTRVWRDGLAVPASVLEARQAGLAPRSQLVRCVPAAPEPAGPGGPQAPAERRVVEVYVPLRVASPVRGDELWLLHPPGDPARAVAAAWFE